MKKLKWHVPKRFIKSYGAPRTSYTFVRLHFYRGLGHYVWLHKKDITLDFNSKTSLEGKHEIMEFAFNKVHDKKFFKNFKIYEFEKELLFSKWTPRCFNCYKWADKKDDFVIRNDKSIQCGKCYKIETIKK